MKSKEDTEEVLREQAEEIVEELRQYALPSLSVDRSDTDDEDDEVDAHE